MTAGAGGLGRARAYALVAAAALLCYAGTLVNGFVWDDRDLILDDPRTHRLRDAASFLVRPFGLGVGDRRNAAYYRPVVNMSFALEYALFGARPWAYHLTNTVLHVAASCGVLAMVAALAGSGRAGALAGLAFALHPVHSESVSWVSGRTDLLACVLMVWCTARLCRTRGKGMVFSYLALAAFAFAVFSKEVALTYPVFLLGADWLMRRGTSPGRWVRERLLGLHLWFLVVLVLFVLMRSVALGGLAVCGAGGAALGSRLLTGCKLIALYVRVLLLPTGLSVEHTIRPGAWTAASTLMGLAVLAWMGFRVGRAAVARGRAGAAPSLPVCCLWFLLMLLPVLNLVPIFDLFAERFAYAPSVAACWAGAVVLAPWARGRVRWLLPAALVCYAALAVDRTQDWRTEARLFSEAAKSAPGSSRARLSLGVTYAQRGRARAAAREYGRSGKLEGRAAGPHNALGNLYMQAGQFDKAIAEFRAAVGLDPGSPAYLVNLAKAHRGKGELDAAVERLRAAVALAPKYGDAHFELGNVCYMRGDVSGASDAFREAVSCDPRYAEAHHNLALCCLAQGSLGEAIDCFGRAISAKPGYAAAHRNLGYTYSKLGRRALAIDAYRKAVELAPDDVSALLDLAMLVRERGDIADAVALYRRALRLDPTNTRALRGHSLALGMLKARPR